ncbi:hypothetical protein RchiOBHm_Chr1g0374081 [Rosa chinensis]|uniref:Uncharacterized protein n=1 Tax=Rosa chinensis TaxID=74649 RepID=A0A2P6SM99_ROSCH|nr:uncharacterized protein LOC112196971 [Rosa chinensis]PRQ59791.1 hypothetical protein RchiOBHm_Chr1g0374081 [Rosa chinensis]
MMFGGRSMGGGGSMFRSVSRAALTRTTGVAIQEPITSSSSNTSTTTTTATSPSASRNTQKPGSVSNLCLSSPTSPNCGHVSASSGGPNWPTSPQFDDFDWVSVDGSEDVEKAHGFLDDFVLGPVPSGDEVHNAVSALQQVFTPTHHPQFVRDKFGSEYLDKDVADQILSASGSVQRVSSFGTESDWMEPSAYLCNSQPQGCQRVYEAFSLLQNESSVQRMVVSLSSDRAVWDAVMNNEVVRELRESFYTAEDNSSQSSSEDSDDNSTATNFLRWIFQNTYGKVMEVIENITKLFDHLLQPQGSGKTKAEAGNLFEERLRTSVMLSVMVLLVVVVTRTHSA